MTRGVLWGKLLWWLTLNTFIVVAAFLLEAALGGIALTISVVAWLIVWRRALSLAAKTDL
jgi:hypothetical protein